MSASSKKQKDTYISKTAITRIIKDVRQLEKSSCLSWYILSTRSR